MALGIVVPSSIKFFQGFRIYDRSMCSSRNECVFVGLKNEALSVSLSDCWIEEQ